MKAYVLIEHEMLYSFECDRVKVIGAYRKIEDAIAKMAELWGNCNPGGEHDYLSEDGAYRGYGNKDSVRWSIEEIDVMKRVWRLEREGSRTYSETYPKMEIALEVMVREVRDFIGGFRKAPTHVEMDLTHARVEYGNYYSSWSITEEYKKGA